MLDLMQAPASPDATATEPPVRSPVGGSIGGSVGGLIGTSAYARMLDLVDYGLLLVLDGQQVGYANQTALAELDDGHPLQLLGRELAARNPQDLAALRQALAHALHRRVQTLLLLRGTAGPGAEGLSVSVVPLAEPGDVPAALIIFGRRAMREGLSTDAFARQHRLTAAETRVLKLLCAGCRPGDIAAASGVRLSTVRTQVGNIRAKVGVRDIGGIVRRVARLPPLPCLLRPAVR